MPERVGGQEITGNRLHKVASAVGVKRVMLYHSCTTVQEQDEDGGRQSKNYTRPESER